MVDAVLDRLKGLHPKVIDLALDRVQGLLAALGNPERRLPPVVHIAGTNGKGSTLAYLRAVAEAAGHPVHVYTSPHLVRFAERIRLAGRLIDDGALSEVLSDCETVNGGRPITFFEITTAAAFLVFSRHPAALCLLETGLGGRFDATNVIDRPALTVLTPISLDHQAFLGDTLAAIAGEKAGILKPGVPCICSRQEPEALAVIAAKAAAEGAPLLVEGRDWSVAEAADGLMFRWADEQLALPRPVLPGRHQIHNAGLALAAARALDGVIALPAPALAAGLRSAEWPARLQRLSGGRLSARLPAGSELWLDGGHNPAAGQALAAFIAEHWQDGSVDLVVGMLNSKDSSGFLKPLAPQVGRMRSVAIPGEPNSLSAEQVVEAARREGLAAEASASVASAIEDLAAGGPTRRILICGSLYLAGSVLAEDGGR